MPPSCLEVPETTSAVMGDFRNRMELLLFCLVIRVLDLVKKPLFVALGLTLLLSSDSKDDSITEMGEKESGRNAEEVEVEKE